MSRPRFSLTHLLLAVLPLSALIARTVPEFFVRVGDFILTGIYTALDWLMPMSEMQFSGGGHMLAPSREVTYLQRGVHRRAQSQSMRPDAAEQRVAEDLDNGLSRIIVGPD